MVVEPIEGSGTSSNTGMSGVLTVPSGARTTRRKPLPAGWLGWAHTIQPPLAVRFCEPAGVLARRVSADATAGVTPIAAATAARGIRVRSLIPLQRAGAQK